jgi:hypothetical protein
MAPTAQSRIVDTFFGAVDRLYDAPGWPSIQGKVGWPLPSYGEPGPAAGLRAEHRYLRG